MTEFFGVLALIFCILLVIAVYEVHRLRSINAALTNRLCEVEQKASHWQTAWALEKMNRNIDRMNNTEISLKGGAQAIRDSLIT